MFSPSPQQAAFNSSHPLNPNVLQRQPSNQAYPYRIHPTPPIQHEADNSPAVDGPAMPSNSQIRWPDESVMLQPDGSENFLRRKTPSGTLAAAYDAGSAEWSGYPSKRVMQSTPMVNQLEDRSSFSMSPLQIDSRYGQTSSESSYGMMNTQTWNQQQFMPRINSFSQFPLHSGLAHTLSDGTQIPIVLQSAFQPLLGPTASNAAPYGSFWPNEQYSPYRQSHIPGQGGRPLYGMSPVGDVGAFQMPTNSPRYPMVGSPMNPMVDGSPHNSLTPPILTPMGANMVDAAGQPVGYLSPVPMLAPSQHPMLQNQARLHSITTSLPTTPIQMGNGWSPIVESPVGIDMSGDVNEVRERILLWCNQVYLGLITALHQQRRNSQGRNGEEKTSRPGIYPRPPRRLAAIAQQDQSISRASSIQYQKPGSSGRLASDPKLSVNRFQPYPGQPVPNTNRQVTMSRQASFNRSLQNMQSKAPPTPRSAEYRQDLSGAVSATVFSDAASGLDALHKLCQESNWTWIDGIILGGCLAYGLTDYNKAIKWFSKALENDSTSPEALSNLAGTFLALGRRDEAEQYWQKCVVTMPSYFEAVEHLVGLLCSTQRGKDAVHVIATVEKALREPVSGDMQLQPGFGSSGYSIPGSDNGRMLALIHAKGNMLYALGDNTGAAKAFDEAVLIATGKGEGGTPSLIRRILSVIETRQPRAAGKGGEPILLPPDQALSTAALVFAPDGELPGLRHVPTGIPRKGAISTTSNSLLSLAKIYQDGMASGSAVFEKTSAGVREILSLYYLSLSLQPSPSTANNVGILLAGVQVVAPVASNAPTHPTIPGVVPGSGIALALSYYNYGLNLDSRHAHLYTNLGSLLKDIGQLSAAIKMYEHAVSCDPKFDIALANLANAVKDQGRICDAITYYRKAVEVSPDFAEAVCGLANALNSVCDWKGRGGIVSPDGRLDRFHVEEDGSLVDSRNSHASGWMNRVVEIVEKQLKDGEAWGKGVLRISPPEALLGELIVKDTPDFSVDRCKSMLAVMKLWADQSWEGARIVRMTERATKRLMWLWYQEQYVKGKPVNPNKYRRPRLPPSLSVPGAPTVLPFHTFTCPLTAKQVRMISQRNGLRISCSTLKAPWLPSTVFPPPPPPDPVIRVGYVSSDFNNHPLAHLMQSVFGLHNKKKIKAICYATTASDNSVHRQQIEREAPLFYDASSWSAERLVNQIVRDKIHILVNLNGYTRGAKNEVFAARPAPIQMSFMGFAGTLGAEWCDYLLADQIAIPRETLRPWRRNVDLEDQVQAFESEDEKDWIYSENIIFTKDTFFCCDHKQSAPDAASPQLTWDEEQKTRWQMRKELFPQISDDAVIFGNFNQLYKIEPTTFRSWLRILSHVPHAILWLLRFPDLGESQLRQFARQWASPEVESRIIFTDVAPKHQHISRARVCDLFLDTPECNAHTTAADVLWSGTPLLTLPRYKYKMCSRMAASILNGALPKTTEGQRVAKDLMARNEAEYEERAVALGNGLYYQKEPGRQGMGSGRLVDMRKILFEGRWSCPLFDTARWVRDLEQAYEMAWHNWVTGQGGDIEL